MRIFISALATAAAIATPALAQSGDHYRANVVAPVVGGAVVGTVVGVGTYNGWWGSGAFASALPATAVGAAVTGGVAGVGAMALIDAAIQPCQGFHALLGLNANECVNGVYVGDQPRRVSYVPRRRHVTR